MPGVAALTGGQRVRFDPAHRFNALNDQLGNTVPTMERERLSRIEIHQNHLDLAAESGVYDPWCVDDRDPVPGSQTGPGMHEGGIPVRKLYGDPGRDQRPVARRDRETGPSKQIHPRVTRPGIRRQLQPGIESNDPDGQRRHSPIIRSGSAFTADRHPGDFADQLAAMVHQEAAGAGELIRLTRNHLH